MTDAFTNKIIFLEKETLAIKQWQANSLAKFPVVAKTATVPITYRQGSDVIYQWSVPTVAITASRQVLASIGQVGSSPNDLAFIPFLKNGNISFKVYGTDFTEGGHAEGDTFTKNQQVTICATSDFNVVITTETP